MLGRKRKLGSNYVPKNWVNFTSSNSDSDPSIHGNSHSQSNESNATKLSNRHPELRRIVYPVPPVSPPSEVENDSNPSPRIGNDRLPSQQHMPVPIPVPPEHYNPQLAQLHDLSLSDDAHDLVKIKKKHL